MRIAICDDEKKICLFMKEVINRFYFDSDEEIHINCFEGGKQLLQAKKLKLNGRLKIQEMRQCILQ